MKMNEEKNEEKYIIIDENTPTFSVADVVENEDVDPFGDFLKAYAKKLDVLAKREIMKIDYEILDKKTIYKPEWLTLEDDKNE